MHILVIPSWYSTPTNAQRGSFFREQAQMLQNAGHQVGLLVPPSRVRTWHGLQEIRQHWQQSPAEVQHTVADALPTYRWHWWGFPASFYPPARAHIAFEVFDRYCTRYGHPDVIHAHSALYGGYIAAKLKQRFHIPVVLTEHLSAIIKGQLFPDQRRRLRETLYEMDTCTAVGAPLAQAMQRYAPGLNVEIIGNPVDTTLFDLSAPPPPDEAFRVLVIANLNPNKGIDILLRAFHLAFTGDDARLHIIGDGAERTNLEQLAADLEIASQVEFAGRQSLEAVRDAIQQSHTVVSSSYVETFGLTLIEALACGKPVIATRSGEPENIVNADNGLLVPTGDPDALAQALQTMRQNFAHYDPHRLRANCLEEFGEVAFIHRLETIYRRVLTDRRRAAQQPG